MLCFVVVKQSFIMNSHEVFIHIHQGCFAGTGAIVRLPQCQWSKPDGYGKISQCITTTKHSKAKTVCIFLGIYCTSQGICKDNMIFVIFKVLILARWPPNKIKGWVQHYPISNVLPIEILQSQAKPCKIVAEIKWGIEIKFNWNSIPLKSDLILTMTTI